MRDAFDWLFRNRQTGGITIGQLPNAPLFIWFAAIAAKWLFEPEGDVATALGVVGTLALVWWAIDETLRGVNPFRRMLGALVLAGIAARLVLS